MRRGEEHFRRVFSVIMSQRRFLVDENTAPFNVRRWGNGNSAVRRGRGRVQLLQASACEKSWWRLPFEVGACDGLRRYSPSGQRIAVLQIHILHPCGMKSIMRPLINHKLQIHAPKESAETENVQQVHHVSKRPYSSNKE